MRICTGCQQEREQGQYRPGRNKCKVCDRARKKVYYQANKHLWEGVEERERARDPEGFRQRNREAQARYRASPTNTIKLRYLRTRYGITPEQYQDMLAAQGGVCKICGGGPNGPHARLHVDHDHRTGRVRGLLCFSCNAGLGHLKDDPGLCERAAAYLRA